MKTYAYVTAECCAYRDAVKPGSDVGNRPVSKHGDYSPWPYGKRETSQIACGAHVAVTSAGAGRDVYLMASARKVAKLLGWPATTPPHRCTTREEAGEINRRLKAAGIKSTAEDCYDSVGAIMRRHGGSLVVAGVIDWVMETTTPAGA